MPRKDTAPKPGEWKYDVGEVPNLLTAYERTDKGNAIYTRVWDGRGYRGKKALCPTIRNKAGKIIPEKEVGAQQLAIRRHGEMLAGVEADGIAGGPLTLAGGFRRLLDPKQGKFPADSGHRRVMVRASREITRVLGKDLTWERMRHREYRTLWRQLANEHKKDASKFGLRAAEILCSALQSTARWLQKEGYLEPGDGVPAPGWKPDLRTEWESITGKPVGNPDKPRYSEVEFAKLWAARYGADPRVKLAFEIGAELRLGQVARVRRSDVLPHGGFRIGKVQVHGRGKKRGETIILTREQRHALTAALLWGYLAEVEKAFRSGEIGNFYLICGGRVHRATDHKGRSVARVRKESGGSVLERRAMARQWEDLEEAAGVAHIDGRLWYGARRLQADKADAMKDVEARVKNRLGGWTKTSTREGYLEGPNTKDAEAAADVRKRLRPKGKDDPKPVKLPPPVTPSEKPGVTPEGKDHLTTDADAT